MVIVTHELPSIYDIADRIIMLDKRFKGIVATGDPHHLRDYSKNKFVKQFFNRTPDRQVTTSVGSASDG